ncbi:hypothetical protein [Ruminococcus sp. HUN007]|uniref:hypothetical protein n=1 Tax=Ruminococcus sp. HUN007 TaxID=1514668 RepID=UPI0005D2701D|nr:hypothetical protein [Ruminococcus sp. HUN007]
MGRSERYSGTGDDFLTAELNRNFLSMKKIRHTRSAFFIISCVLLAAQLTFTVIGGINVFMLSGLILNAVTCGFCMNRSHKTFALLVLAVINVLLFALYLIYVCTHKLYIDYFIAIAGHLFLAVEAFVTSKHRELEFELSSQPGYPYFTELAKIGQERKEYTPDNDMTVYRNKASGVMDEVDMNAVYDDQHTRVKPPKKEIYEMPGVSMQDVPERFYADPYDHEEKLHAERKSDRY